MYKNLQEAKPFKDYDELAQLLVDRGMNVSDFSRAKRKLSQVGYYRLSGFWFPCRSFEFDCYGKKVIKNGKPVRLSKFECGTDFDSVFSLYIFDKKMRQLMLDVIERVEVHFRSVVAHEIGYHDPLGYKNEKFINRRQCADFQKKNSGQVRNAWKDWSLRQQTQLDRCREDCIDWHRKNNMAIPFWVAVEAWDLGTLSKYFEMLNGSYQNKISTRLGVDNGTILKSWLQEINTLRNRCAHHTRIWNQSSRNNIPVPSENDYFDGFGLDDRSSRRLFGLIVILWFLVKKIGPGSKWIESVADVVDTIPALPGCSLEALGIFGCKKFPRQLFGI